MLHRICGMHKIQYPMKDNHIEPRALQSWSPQTSHCPYQLQAGKSPAWKLNQELQATVIATKANQTRLRIEGQTFETQTAIALKPGQSLLIKVVSLEPQISFALINPATRESGATAHQSVVISEKLVQMESTRTRSGIADLMNLINNHSASVERAI